MVLRAAVVGLVLVVLSGCGGSEPGELVGTTSEAVPAATVDTAAAGVAALGVDPCGLVTVAEVRDATGFEVTETIPEPPLACRFDLDAASGVHIWVAVDDGQGRLAGPAAIYADYSSRLGDEHTATVDDLAVGAVYDSGYRGLAVDAGEGRYLVVAVGGGFGALEEPRQQLVGLARSILGRLPGT